MHTLLIFNNSSSGRLRIHFSRLASHKQSLKPRPQLRRISSKSVKKDDKSATFPTTTDNPSPFMQMPSTRPHRFFFTAALALAGFLGVSSLTASADTYDFNNGAGGDGVWENGTPIPPAPAASPWSDGGTQNLAWDNTLSNTAYFGGAGGTVNVANDVTANYLQFNASSNITLNGTGTITVETGNGVFENDTNNNLTINNNIQLDDSTASDRFDIGDGGANTLTLGSISYVGSLSRSAGLDLIFNTGASTVVNLNGTYQGSATTPGRMELENGTMYLNGNFTNESAGGSLLAVDAGVVYVNTNNLGTGSIDLYGGGGQATPEVLTIGARTVSQVNGLNYAFTNPFTSGDIVVGGSTADLSTFTTINLVVTGLTLTAAENGRVDVGSIVGNGDISGLIKTGAGTVVLESASSVPVTNGFNGLTPPYVADIQQGTLLINNPVGTSAFGSGGGTIRLRAGATLGGNGAVGNNQQVVVDGPPTPNGPTAVIAPGDAGQSNLGINASLGTLTLAGGLSAPNGLTMDFKLTPNLDGDGGTAAPGKDNDYITGTTIALNGNVTINFSDIGGIATGTPYTLLFATNTLSGNPDFTFNVPTGYALDPDYGFFQGTSGYIYSTVGGTFSVQFIAVPEPSTYAMLFGGLAFLAFRLRRRTVFVS
jgi:hypothetical protein